MQGLTAGKRLCTRPQPLALPTPSPGEVCQHDCTECRLMPGGGPVDHPASHGDEVTHAGRHQLRPAQEERTLPEQRSSPSACQHTRCSTLADLASILRLLCHVLWATGTPCPAGCMPLPIGCSNIVQRALLSAM